MAAFDVTGIDPKLYYETKIKPNLNKNLSYCISKPHFVIWEYKDRAEEFGDFFNVLENALNNYMALIMSIHNAIYHTNAKNIKIKDITSGIEREDTYKHMCAVLGLKPVEITQSDKQFLAWSHSYWQHLHTLSIIVDIIDDKNIFDRYALFIGTISTFINCQDCYTNLILKNAKLVEDTVKYIVNFRSAVEPVYQFHNYVNKSHDPNRKDFTIDEFKSQYLNEFGSR